MLNNPKVKQILLAAALLSIYLTAFFDSTVEENPPSIVEKSITGLFLIMSALVFPTGVYLIGRLFKKKLSNFFIWSTIIICVSVSFFYYKDSYFPTTCKFNEEENRVMTTARCTGTFTSSSGDIYTGEFDKGLRNGKGIYKYKSGNVYEGEFLDGLPHGQGTLTWSDGEKFTGEFEYDNFVKGILERVNGDIYEGGFKDKMFHGKGTYKSADGTVIEGEFEYDNFVKGIIKMVNGDIYEGGFKDKMFNGKVTYKSGDSRVIEEEFLGFFFDKLMK